MKIQASSVMLNGLMSQFTKRVTSRLANGTKAPDIEMVDVANKAGERLSNYAGKIIVLEFWATWCVPCQRKMAELQSYPDKHPDWQSKVVLIAARVDENAEVAAKHLKGKGWNQTHNLWVELPAIRAPTLTAFPRCRLSVNKERLLR